MDSIQGDLQMLTRQCASNASLDASQILNCTTSRTGNQRQHGNAVQTEQGKPVNAPVPWVNLNGESTEEIQEQAQTNLVRLLCQTYKVKSAPLPLADKVIVSFRGPIHPLDAQRHRLSFSFATDQHPLNEGRKRMTFRRLVSRSLK